MRRMIAVFISHITECENSAYVFPAFGPSKRVWIKSVALGTFYGLSSLEILFVGNKLLLLDAVSSPPSDPLRAILYAPVRETIFLIFLIYFLRVAYQAMNCYPRVLSILVVFSIGLAFGWAHALEAASHSNLWFIMRFCQSGIIFVSMALQWEAILRFKGHKVAFSAVALSHSVDSLLIHVIAD